MVSKVLSAEQKVPLSLLNQKNKSCHFDLCDLGLLQSRFSNTAWPKSEIISVISISDNTYAAQQVGPRFHSGSCGASVEFACWSLGASSTTDNKKRK